MDDIDKNDSMLHAALTLAGLVGLVVGAMLPLIIGLDTVIVALLIVAWSLVELSSSPILR